MISRGRGDEQRRGFQAEAIKAEEVFPSRTVDERLETEGVGDGKDGGKFRGQMDLGWKLRWAERRTGAGRVYGNCWVTDLRSGWNRRSLPLPVFFVLRELCDSSMIRRSLLD